MAKENPSRLKLRKNLVSFKMSNSNTPLLHPKTKKQAGLFLQKPTSSLLILGERGSGKLDLAFWLAARILKLNSHEELAAYPYFFHIKKNEGKQDISIDAAREIKRFLHLKTPGDMTVRRVVVIEDSQLLSSEAQNALLKVLEEPNPDTLFILTALSQQSLLPTIVSRCRHMWAQPVSLKQADYFYSAKFGSKKLTSAWRLSRGSSALLKALLDEADSHPLKIAIEDAKTFLKRSRYERLLVLEKIVRNKEEFRLFLEALSKIIAVLHHSAIDKHKTMHITQLLNDRKAVTNTLEALELNANTRLLGLNLVQKLQS
jgi:DNA polymerase-3 subunit delta'